MNNFLTQPRSQRLLWRQLKRTKDDGIEVVSNAKCGTSNQIEKKTQKKPRENNVLQVSNTTKFYKLTTLTTKMFGAKIFGENIFGEQMFGGFLSNHRKFR